MLPSLRGLRLRRIRLDRLPAIVARPTAEPSRWSAPVVAASVGAVPLLRETALAVVAALAWRPLLRGVFLQLDSFLRGADVILCDICLHPKETTVVTVDCAGDSPEAFQGRFDLCPNCVTLFKGIVMRAVREYQPADITEYCSLLTFDQIVKVRAFMTAKGVRL